MEKVGRREKAKRFFKGGVLLAIAAVIAKLLGVLYRIPLTNIVGAEGIGLYQMIFPFYVLLLTISSGGLPLAISRVVAEKLARGDEKSATRILRVSVLSLSIIGAVCTALLIIFRGNIARLQGNQAASLAYLAIAPSVFFVAIIACFRGYFQGRQNMLPSSISNLTEQVIKLAVGLALVVILLPYGLQYAIFGALLGVTISEIITLLVLVFIYIGLQRRRKKKTKLSTAFEFSTDLTYDATVLVKTESRKSLLGQVYRVAIPITLGSIIMPLVGIIDSFIVVNMLTRANIALSTATSMFGVLTGPVGTLVNMPTVITLAFSVALLPKLTALITKKESTEKEIKKSYRLVVILSAIFSVGLLVFARLILKVLYFNGLNEAELALATRLLRLSAVSVFFVSTMQIGTSILQAHKKAYIPALALLAGAIVKVILTVTLLPAVGIVGAAIGSVSCFALACLIIIISARRSAELVSNEI